MPNLFHQEVLALKQQTRWVRLSLSAQQVLPSHLDDWFKIIGGVAGGVAGGGVGIGIGFIASGASYAGTCWW